MKIQLIVLLALSLCVTSRDYDDNDEGRPYEFGFTIDGQQHRHESKDVNGIVMGEFGFITADGIYHVTVYATDENGSFKILSMRNVRVSGPLDEPGYEFPSKTSGTVQQFQPQNNPPPPPPTTTLAPTTNFKAPYVFTTLPSLNVPACSSCKLPSTTPKAPGASNKLPFQTPEFQNKKPINKIPPSPQFNNPPVVPQSPPLFNSPAVPQKQPFNNLPVAPPSSPFSPPVAAQIPPGFNRPEVPQRPVVPQSPPAFNPPAVQQKQPFNNLPVAPPSSPFSPPVAAQIPHGFNRPEVPQHPVANIPKAGDENLDNYGNPVKPSIEQQPPFPNPVSNYPSNDIPANPSPFAPTHENLQNPPFPGVQTPVRIPDQSSKPTNLNFPNPGPVGLPKPPPVTVSNHQINIPGRDPIPIKDPYPNMVDGLPNGITEGDMLDILYKFNYTLGFHGHHERGLKNGAKIGAYFVNGRDGIMRVVEYIADENGYRPKVKFINLGLDSPDTPKEGSEKTFGLKGFEFVWYPI